MKTFCDKIEKEYDRVVSYIFVDPSAAGLIEEIRKVIPIYRLYRRRMMSN